MPASFERAAPDEDSARLLAELDQAQAYEQKLRQMIVEVRDQLARGHTGVALSLLNQALSYIDNESDVVAPSPVAKEPDKGAQS